MNSQYDNYEEVDDDIDDVNNYLAPGNEKKRRKYLLILQWIIVFLFVLFCSYAGFLKYKYNKMISNRESNIGEEAKNFISPGPLRGENSGDINVLVLGMRPNGMVGAYLSSAMMIVNIDIKNQKINLISIPRDLWIPIDGKNGKANSVYKTAITNPDKYPQGAVEFSKQTFSSVFGININYTFVANFDGFKKIIDDAGLVSITIPSSDIENYPFLKDPAFTVAKDKTDPYTYHLDGANSLTFVRWPENAVPDFDRLKRIQLFVTSARSNYFNAQILLNPLKVDAILTDGGENIKMDFQAWEVKKLINLINNISLENVSQHKLTTNVGTDGGLLYQTNYSNTTYSPIDGNNNFSAIQTWVKNIINN